MDWSTLLNVSRRRKSMTTPTESRTEFQRDYDRALFSSSVRRLQDKAQVFPLERHDSIRTRLTHSHEVGNVARGLTDRALTALQVDSNVRECGVVIAGTAGLVHDLGNPPFGHAGEQAISSWFETDSGVSALKKLEGSKHASQLKRDFTAFEGNAQTLRILTRLQLLHDDNGLNLTFGTLSATRKYVAPSDGLEKNNASRKKTGFFFSERGRVEEIESHTGCSGCRNPLTYLVEAADDIVYSAVDLEDGITKGAISWAEFSQHMALCKDAEWQKVKAYVDDTVSNSPHYTFFSDNDPQSLDSLRSQLFRTRLIASMVSACSDAYLANATAIMSGSFRDNLVDVCATSELINCVKKIEKQFVYPYKSTLKLEVRGRHVIHDLMHLFWEAVENAEASGPTKTGFAARLWKLLSPSFRIVFANAYEDAQGDVALQTYAKLQLVCDYVSGMTDNFACDLHSELYG